MKKKIFLLLLFVLPLVASAQVQIGTLWYNLSEAGAEVTFPGDDTKYEGDIVIPESITVNDVDYSVISIGEWAFAHDYSLTSISIPSSVTNIGNGAFRGCSSFASIIVDADNSYYDSRGNCNAIIETASNTLILGCNNTIIPSSVTNIGDYAFSGCSGLTNIEIPSSVTNIGDFAFSDCSGLTNIEIPSSVTSIGEYAFSSCSGLTRIIIPNSVTAIETAAFAYCSGLTEVTLSNNLKSIEGYVFTLCNLTSIYIPASVEKIESSAFNLNPDLRTIDIDGFNPAYTDCSNTAIVETATNTLLIGSTWGYIPQGITSIGDFAFCGRNIMNQHIDIPEGVVSIGEYVFSGSSVSSIHLPNTLKTCGIYAFSYPVAAGYESNITRVDIDDLTAWFNIDFATSGSNPLYDGANLYLNGQLLNSITIPTEIEKLKQCALIGWLGKEVVIPAHITAIERDVLSRCENLESVTCHIPADEIFRAYSLNSKKCTLYVPTGAKNSYVVNEWDKYFDPIIEMELEPFTLNVSSVEYATLYLTESVEIPENVEVYTAGEVGNGYVYLNPVTDVIPANTGVVVHAEAGTYDFAYYTGESVSPVLNNLFKGTAVDEYITPSKGKAAYVLSAVDGEVGFYRAQLTDGQFLNNANKAYLEVPELALNEGEIDSSEQLSLKFKFPEATSVENVELSANGVKIYYDLQGRKVAQPTRGLYILNGKKVLVK